ncbi:MAG: peptide/nickel transport system ATP-binding protein, partial [Chloroflexota bacterium]|nr:peptide/nickel transport system ATP-binding protein [Chloroflexota bacterium]
MNNGAERKRLVRVTGLRKYFPVEKGMLRRNAGWLKAVDGVTFDIHESETLGMVGESGCGKSTIGKALLRAFPVTAGQLVYSFEDREVDVSLASPGELRGIGFRRRTQMIFQDPNSSL